MTPINALQDRLSRQANKKTKAWFENYLKHAIEYRGVKIPTVTKIVSKWRDDMKLSKLKTF